MAFDTESTPMMDRLFNDAQIPLLEKMVKFTTARNSVLADDVANLSTPDFQPKDLSLDKFQQLLRERGTDTQAGQDAADEALQPKPANDNILFHDRNNRSVEQLMSDQASNALMHNMMIELLRKQFSQIQDALKEHVG